MGGNACHSSIKRGVVPSKRDLGLISIICALCFSTVASPRSSTLLANCFAVVVLPHHLGPSIRTAPFPRTLRSRSLSAIRCLYFTITLLFRPQRYNFYRKPPKEIGVFGDLRRFYSVVCGIFVRLIVTIPFGESWKGFLQIIACWCKPHDRRKDDSCQLSSLSSCHRVAVVRRRVFAGSVRSSGTRWWSGLAQCSCA